jgi:hypothetical protein
MSWCRDMAVGADVVGAVLSIVTLMMTLKTFGESSSRALMNRYLNETSGGGQQSTVVSEPYHERLVKFHDIFI